MNVEQARGESLRIRKKSHKELLTLGDNDKTIGT